MSTMDDLDELALAMPETTKEVSDDGRPAYKAHGKLCVLHRGRRPDAKDPATGERLGDVLMFRLLRVNLRRCRRLRLGRARGGSLRGSRVHREQR